MPCEYMRLRVQGLIDCGLDLDVENVEQFRQQVKQQVLQQAREREKKEEAMRKKKTAIAALVQMGFEVDITTLENGDTLIEGSREGDR